jgi:serine/threonine protein kinase
MPDFLVAQKAVLPKPTQHRIWSHDTHHYFNDKAYVPLDTLQILGQGGTAQVYLSYERSTQRRVACKQAYRTGHGGWRTFGTMVQEIKLMSAIVHPHCLTYLGSYTTPDSIGMLLPAADGDLKCILESELPPEQSSVQNWFGCLASAVLYLHNNHIW